MITDIDSYVTSVWHVVSDASLLAALWWLALCALVAWLAYGKGHSGTGFFLIALVFTPLVGLLAVVAVRDLRAAAEERAAGNIVREIISPLALQIDGIRAHLAVSGEQVRSPLPPMTQPAPKPQMPPPPPMRAGAKALQ